MPVWVGGHIHPGLRLDTAMSPREMTHHQRACRLGVDGFRPGQRSRTIRSTMISPLERDNVLSPRGLSRNFDGRLDGLAPRVPEEEAVEGRMGHGGEETFDELEVRCVKSDRALKVDKVVHLRCRCRTDSRVTTTISENKTQGGGKTHCPRLVTPIPAVKSKRRLPSAVMSSNPCPLTMTWSLNLPSPWDT